MCLHRYMEKSRKKSLGLPNKLIRNKHIQETAESNSGCTPRHNSISMDSGDLVFYILEQESNKKLEKNEEKIRKNYKKKLWFFTFN